MYFIKKKNSLFSLFLNMKIDKIDKNQIYGLRFLCFMHCYSKITNLCPLLYLTPKFIIKVFNV